MASFDDFLRDVRGCTACSAYLPLGPNPVLYGSPDARLMIRSQAPGTRVHATGIAFGDASGDRLRDWMGIGKTLFYDQSLIAISPMGMCYPGKGKGGDLPPRPECAPLWHRRIDAHMQNIGLTLLVGQYAIAYYLSQERKKTLAETVYKWRDYYDAPNNDRPGHCYFPLPHPSPRNRRWFANHPWFERDVVPAIRNAVQDILHRPNLVLSHVLQSP